jgi:hypothetical protein
MNMDEEEFPNNALGRCLSECLEKGFKFPMRSVSIDVNDTVVAVKYMQDDAQVVHVEYLVTPEQDTIYDPVHVFIVDAAGQAATFVIGADGAPRLLH